MIDRPTEDEPQTPSSEGVPELHQYSESQETDSDSEHRFAANNHDLTDLYSDLFQKKQSSADTLKVLPEDEDDQAVSPLKNFDTMANRFRHRKRWKRVVCL